MSGVEVLYSPKIGRGYSTTTAHGEIGEMGTLEEQAVRAMENVKASLSGGLYKARPGS